MESSRAMVRCVLWRARGSRVPDELAGALEKRGLAYIEVDGPYAAMAEACTRARAGSGCVLLLVEPAGLVRADDALRALETHAPGVSCWAYAKGAKPELRALTRADPTASPPKPASEAPAPTNTVSKAPAPRPALRLTSDNFASPKPDPEAGAVRTEVAGFSSKLGVEGGSAGDDGTNLLTEEELAMLLGERPRAMG